MTRNVGGDLNAGERPLGGEPRERLRLAPGQRAAEQPLTAAQCGRHELVLLGAGQTRAGKAHQYAALPNPSLQALLGIADERSDVGQDQYRDALLQERIEDVAMLGSGAVRNSANGLSARVM